MTFTVTGPAGEETSTRSPLRAYFLLLWHGVFPSHAVHALSLMRTGSSRAMAEAWQHTEPFGVGLDYATGRKAR